MGPSPMLHNCVFSAKDIPSLEHQSGPEIQVEFPEFNSSQLSCNKSGEYLLKVKVTGKHIGRRSIKRAWSFRLISYKVPEPS